jgi:glycosyltransferase involved in cell wall biosynthesis
MSTPLLPSVADTTASSMIGSAAGVVADTGSPVKHSMLGRVKQWTIRRVFRISLAAYLATIRVARALGPATRRVPESGAEILLTGTFYSDNWIRSHVYPLSLSRRCRRILIVSTYPVPAMDKVELVRPPAWLTRAAGNVVARLFTFAWVAFRRRPDVVAGFHLLLNGLAAGLLARMVGAQAMYFCVGGPNETVGGGIYADNRLFAKLREPDTAVERRLNQVVDTFDLVIAMGTGAVRHYRQCGVRAAFRVVAGGIDGSRFRSVEPDLPIDFVFVGRLAPVKRLDLFLGALQLVQHTLPDVRATIVGDGELRDSLEQLARALGVDRHVSFVGQQDDVEAWLRKSKVFVLPSDSEGLSLSLMEAMRCGLPAVVSKTGDLGDLVDDGVNGYLVAGRTAAAFAAPLTALLTDDACRARFSAAASKAAERYDVHAVTGLWDEILADAGRIGGAERAPQ